jgi:hypothetical protein
VVRSIAHCLACLHAFGVSRTKMICNCQG